MGKNLIQQARGKGSPRYRAPSFRYKGRANHMSVKDPGEGKVLDLIKCSGHSAPLAKVQYGKEEVLMIAPEGMKVGDSVNCGPDVEIKQGNTIELGNAPEGTLIYNIESKSGDGGKFCRSGGTFARVLTRMENGSVVVMLPSKKQRAFSGNCRANIGIIAGGGRKEKPFLKAGTKHFYMKARNKLWPKVSGAAQNAVDHPFGNARTSRKSKAKPISRDAPPGRKVGMIAARRTGRKKK